jgi:hypothetical protein
MISFDLRQFSRVCLDSLLPRGSGSDRALLIEFGINVRSMLNYEWLLPEHQRACDESEEDDGVCERILEGMQIAYVQLVYMRPANYTRVLLRSGLEHAQRRDFRNDPSGEYQEIAYHDSCWDDDQDLRNLVRTMQQTVITDKSSLVLAPFAGLISANPTYSLFGFSVKDVRARSEFSESAWHLSFLK